jgi:hypothetical protein
MKGAFSVLGTSLVKKLLGLWSSKTDDFENVFFNAKS